MFIYCILLPTRISYKSQYHMDRAGNHMVNFVNRTKHIMVQWGYIP